MMKMILDVLLIIIFHITVFVLYPDTSKNGDIYLYGLIAVWIFIYLYLSSSLFYKFLPLSFLFKAVFFAAMMVISLFIIPQSDGKSIIKKIKNGQFPDRQQIERGKIKYLNRIFSKNTKIPEIINPVKKDIEEKTKLLIKEMNE